MFDRANPGTGAVPPSPDRSDFLLRGLVRCGACDAALPGVTTHKARARFRYYRCLTRDRRGKEACALQPVRAADLEGLVVGQIRDAIRAGGLGPAVLLAGCQQLEEHRAALTAERDRLHAMFTEHTLGAEALAQEMACVAAEQRTAVENAMTAALAEAATAERRLIEIDRAQVQADALTLDHAWVAETLAHFDPIWDALTQHERERIVNLLVERVVLRPDRSVDVEWRGAAP